MLVLLLPSLLAAADAPPAPRATTADDLQNLVACCTRLTVGQLTPAEMQALAIAESHAIADIKALREPPPAPATASRSTTSAAVKQ